MENPLEIIRSRFGRKELGDLLGITGQAVSQWKKVPIEHVLTLERLTKIPRYEIRPDIYPPPKSRAAALAVFTGGR